MVIYTITVVPPSSRAFGSFPGPRWAIAGPTQVSSNQYSTYINLEILLKNQLRDISLADIGEFFSPRWIGRL